MTEDPAIQERRLTTVAGVILMTVGIIDAVVGLALLVASAGTVLTGPFVATTALLGGPVLVVSTIEFLGGTRAYKARNFYEVTAAAILGTVVVLPITLDLVAAFLLFRILGRFTGVGTVSVVLLVTVEQFYGIGVVAATVLGGLVFFGLPLLDLVAVVLVVLGEEEFAGETLAE